MSEFKSVLKGGWHPKGKDGGRESWRGDFKGINQVAGWMGKGKQSESQQASEHVSRPLAALKDPSSFGPPPKNVNYHGGAALPNEITPHRSGLGAPLSHSEIEDAKRATAATTLEEEEASARPPPPALPYRADRTGLRTDNLPPPPIHRDINPSAVPAQPRLPPRLPSRQNTASPIIQETPPPTYEAVPSSSATTTPVASPYLNQSAVNRLGKAGISVPGLGISKQGESNPWQNERSPSQGSGSGQMSELQSRFARMKSPSQDPGVSSAVPVASNAQSPPPTSLPSWKQSQSALQTAQNLRTNPQSVSIADAQSAAQTAGQAQRSAGAFRERHADSIANAQAKAKAWDQRYKVTSKINKFLDEHADGETAPQQQQQQQQQPSVPSGGQVYSQQAQPQEAYNPSNTATHHSALAQSQAQTSSAPNELAASIARKPPPPPAPRKPANLQAPPPVPVGTKPNFG